MGREVKRVPMDFDFPIGRSHADAMYEAHEQTCDKEEHDECDWVRDPPKGDGWQLWQTVSDGPVSPVFKTPEELIDFMAAPESDPVRASRGSPWAQGWPRDVAESFVRGSGWAPSFVMSGGQLMDGVTFSAKAKP